MASSMPRKFRGIEFRIGALTALLVMLVVAILGLANYAYVSGAMHDRLRQELASEIDTIRGADRARSVQAMANEIKRHRAADGPRKYFYQLATNAGGYVRGDRWLRPGDTRFGVRNFEEDERTTAQSEWLLVMTVDAGAGYRLVVGRDMEWIAEVEDELLEILGWTLLGGAVLSLLAATLVSRMIATRIGIVSQTAASIMDGDLAQRIPLSGAGDQFDRLSGTLNTMLDRLSGVMANLEQVSDDIAHDLRTPLARLRNRLEAAGHSAISKEEKSAAIDDAIAEADGLLSTFTALLRIAQIDSGVSRSEFRLIDLSTIASSVVEAYEPSVTDSGRTLESRIAPNVELTGDKDLLTQMFANLIENAMAHTPAGTAISVSLLQQDREIIATVTDDGPGVPANERERIFRRFYRREASRTTPGTGLGLSLVAAVARVHGATIQAQDNAPGLRIVASFPRSMAA